MRLLRNTLIFFGLTLLLVLAGIVCAVTLVMRGPSVHARDLMTLSLRETSALYWIPDLFLSETEIADIVASNTMEFREQDIDTEKIVIETPAEDDPTPPIEVFEISGATYVGDVMLIHQPSRVFIGHKGPYDGSAGKVVSEICELNGAIAGINGGGFLDPNGMGNGGTPDGFVIAGGQIAFGHGAGAHVTIGINSEDKLIIGRMTAQEALSNGLRDAVCVQTHYAPVLIVNGEAQNVSGSGGGINPRTAIGQSADGTIIFVTTDGRQANSLGSTFSDMIQIMQGLGAVNAASLDGGSSTQMYYEGEYLNTPYALSGPRIVPNAFLVRPEEEVDTDG